MVFAYDTGMALRAAAAVVNSAPGADGADTLATIADLDAFYREWRYTGRRDRDAAEVAEVRSLRPRLRALLTATRDEAVELVNAALAESRLDVRLVRHEEYDWHVHAVDAEAPLAERILVETAMAMIDVIRGDELSRLGVCADATCDDIVLDLSRNRSKRFCSTTCANRNAVAAYRARKNL